MRGVTPDDDVVLVYGVGVASAVQDLSARLGAAMPPVIVLATEPDPEEFVAAVRHGAISYLIEGRFPTGLDGARYVTLGVGTSVLLAAGVFGAVNASASSVNDHVVATSDPILQCEGPSVPSGGSCEVDTVEIKSQAKGRKDAVKVTDDVAGCVDGNQPSVAKQISYSLSTSISYGGSVSLKIVPGFSEVFKEIGPQAGVTVAQSTTFGNSRTDSVPADYGFISWGIFSQDTVEADVVETIKVQGPSRSGGKGGTLPGTNSFFKSDGTVHVSTPVIEGELPVGTLAKGQRAFASADEFRQICGPNAPLPPGL